MISAHIPLITFSTTLAVTEVIDRLEKILKEKNITVFARIRFSQNAEKIGLNMQDEELIVFGNPKAGTPLMIESPAIGIELPLKILAWEENGKTMVGFKDMEKLATEYQITTSIDTIKLLKNMLINTVESAIK